MRRRSRAVRGALFDWSYYGVWAQRCDDKAFFRNIVITHRVAEL